MLLSHTLFFFRSRPLNWELYLRLSILIGDYNLYLHIFTYLFIRRDRASLPRRRLTVKKKGGRGKYRMANIFEVSWLVWVRGRVCSSVPGPDRSFIEEN